MSELHLYYWHFAHMPIWVPGTGGSPPGVRRSPETTYSLSSSSSGDRRLVAVDSGSGMAEEGLQVSATRASLRESSAVSRDGRSAGSWPPLEDGAARERSPRREPIGDFDDHPYGAHRSRGPIEDIDNRPYGALRSRGRESSPREIADQSFHRRATSANRSRDVSRTRTLLDAPSSSLAVFEDDTLGDDLATAMDEDLEPGDSEMDRNHSRPRTPTRDDHLSLPSGPAQPLGPPVAATFAAQSNFDQSVTNQAVVSNDYRSVTVNTGLTTQEADALVKHEVEQTQALANVAYDALTKDAQAVIADLTRKLHEAIQRAEATSQREEATKASAERQAKECSEREKELSAESSRMLRRVEVDMQRAFDEVKTTKAAGERRFDALAAES